MSRRLPLVVLLIIGLLVTGLTRKLAIDQRRARVARVQGASSDQSLDRMSSFTLALLLGGLRGPLAMILWTSSETQKNERNLDDIDTKINLIRLLQSEFDTVHLFQIWNKGYNLSVQMANLPNKYATILDALDYAFNVEREKPDNLNILFAISDLLFAKLGDSAERIYYSNRLRDDSLPAESSVRIQFDRSRRDALMKASRAAGLDSTRVAVRGGSSENSLVVTVRKHYADRIRAALGETGVTYTELAAADRSAANVERRAFRQVLGDDYRMLPELARPVIVRPEGMPADAPFNTRAELQYFPDFKHPDGTLWQFPYGVSPFALGYSYGKRAEFQQTVNDQHHRQFGDKVISSRASLSLMKWTEEEWQRGRRLEIEYLTDAPTPSTEKEVIEQITTLVGLDRPVAANELAKEAIFTYRRASEIAAIAPPVYLAHMRRFVSEELNYRVQLDWVNGMGALCTADADYLAAITTPTRVERQAAARIARESYIKAIDVLLLSALQYYVSNEAVVATFPPGMNDPNLKLQTVPSMTPRQKMETASRVIQRNRLPQFQNEVRDELDEFMSYVDRCQKRVAIIEAFINNLPAPTGPTTAPSAPMIPMPTVPGYN